VVVVGAWISSLLLLSLCNPLTLVASHSVLGTDQNVTAHVTKWNVDGDGVRKGYKGRNRNQKDIVLFDESVEESIEELHENGEDAISLDEQTLQIFKNEHEYLFVDFYASWCSHCKDLAPTWETLAEIMVDAGKSSYSLSNEGKHLDDYTEEDYQHALQVSMPVVIAKVDCVTQPEVCNLRENIRAYPTLRLFIDGKTWPGGSDYKGHRTVQEMVDWLAHMEEQHKAMLDKQGDEGEKARKLHAAHEASRQRMGEDESQAEQWREHQKHQMKRIYHEWRESEHPGCQLTGHLLLDRAPGNFHILARSKHHDLAPHLTNVSHMINSLSIGDPMAGMKIINGEATVPKEVKAKISPLDGNVCVTMNLHESYHHYLKVITTKAPGLQVGRRDLKAYQIIPSSQLSYYRNDQVPEAKFVYDLSPISVAYRHSSRRWYAYCTSIFALVGGMFTVVR
jgi:thiol-disulfide isomerase/thioredoxin